MLPMTEKHRMPKDLPKSSTSKVKGTVKFYPFEDLDEESLREVRRFRVTPLGGIRKNCRHIPYNSGKKDFFEKTGRESFEGRDQHQCSYKRDPCGRDMADEDNSLPIYLQITQ
jgi:hypothetical protein